MASGIVMVGLIVFLMAKMKAKSCVMNIDFSVKQTMTK